MNKAVCVTILGLLLTGCASGGGVIPGPGTGAPPRGVPAGVARLMGSDAQALLNTFGPPLLDVREGSARKLQFGNATCVLDAYLYPQRGGEAAVTHIDARQRDGSPVDEASCVAALRMR